MALDVGSRLEVPGHTGLRKGPKWSCRPVVSDLRGRALISEHEPCALSAGLAIEKWLRLGDKRRLTFHMVGLALQFSVYLRLFEYTS